MNQAMLQVIRNEIEKIEASGFGEVVIQIQNGTIKMIKPTPFIRFDCQKDALSHLDNNKKMV